MNLTIPKFQMGVQAMAGGDPNRAKAIMAEGMVDKAFFDAAKNLATQASAAVDKREQGRVSSQHRANMAELVGRLETTQDLDVVADADLLDGIEFKETDGAGNARAKIPVYEVYSQIYDKVAEKSITDLAGDITLPASRDGWVQNMKTSAIENSMKIKVRSYAKQRDYQINDEMMELDAKLQAGDGSGVIAEVSSGYSLLTPSQKRSYINKAAAIEERNAITRENAELGAIKKSLNTVEDEGQLEELQQRRAEIFTSQMKRAGVEPGTPGYKSMLVELNNENANQAVNRAINSGDIGKVKEELNNYKKHLTSAEILTYKKTVDQYEVNAFVKGADSLIMAAAVQDKPVAKEKLIQEVKKKGWSKEKTAEAIREIDSTYKRYSNLKKEQDSGRYNQAMNNAAVARTDAELNTALSGLSVVEQNKAKAAVKKFKENRFVDENSPEAISAMAQVELFMTKPLYLDNKNPRAAVDSYIVANNLSLSQKDYKRFVTTAERHSQGLGSTADAKAANLYWGKYVNKEVAERPLMWALFSKRAAEDRVGSMSATDQKMWAYEMAKDLNDAEFNTNSDFFDKSLKTIYEEGRTIEFDEIDNLPFGMDESNLNDAAMENFGAVNDGTKTAVILMRAGVKLPGLVEYLKETEAIPSNAKPPIYKGTSYER